MDPSEIDALVQRLVNNPHDEEALGFAHQAGGSDPKGYAYLLERVGNESIDPAYSAHWLSEAANVYLTTLGDAHRAARLLMAAIDKDPSQAVAAERLGQLYREKGDMRALVALLDRRAKSLMAMVDEPEIRAEIAAMHEELGRLWQDAPLSQPRKAIEHFAQALEIEPRSAFAIYSLRELYKSQGQWAEALPLYHQELAIEQDPARQIALLRDEAHCRRELGDLSGACEVLSRAREVDDRDPALQQEYAALVLDRAQAGERVTSGERHLAMELLLGLASAYDGDHAIAYAGAALDLDPTSDRAADLVLINFDRASDRAAAVDRLHTYLGAAPHGRHAADARRAIEAGGGVDAIGVGGGPVGGSGAPPRGDSFRPAPDSFRPGAQHTSGPPSAPPPVRRVSEAPGGGGFGLSPDKIQGVLDAAQMLAGKGKRDDAHAKFQEVLDADPAHPEALSWVEDYLRSKRDYAKLRDVLLASVRAQNSHATLDNRKERLREVAGLCEGNLKDIDGAVAAWNELLSIDRGDDSARQSLTRLLERSQRWDDLAGLLEQEATAASDIDAKITLEKRLASLSEHKRRDYVGAAEAWERIARLTPDDDRPVSSAARLYEKAGKLDLAARVLGDHAERVDDPVARGSLLERLAELHEQLGDVTSAGDAFAEAGEAQRSARHWENAERCFVTAEAWSKAAHAAGQRGALTGDPKQQASHYGRAAEHLDRVSDDIGAVQYLAQAAELDPIADDYSEALAKRYTTTERWPELVELLAKRGARIGDRSKRVGLRRQAAVLYETRLGDRESAREQWLRVLEDGDDREALEHLTTYALERNDPTEAATLLRRLGNVAVDKADKARIALREAELLADGIGDVDTAIARYELVLRELDPTCRPALQAIADLQEARENFAAAADALERELKLVADASERGQIAGRLARLYEQVDDPKSAIRALDLVRKADPEDFDALNKLCELSERVGQWDRLAELLAERIEVEADETEISSMTEKLARLLADQLDRGDEALAVLTELADSGDTRIREVYLELGDRLGWQAMVAQKLVEWWFDARHGDERTAALRDAFERFADVGREQDATRVAIEIVRARGADQKLAARLETLAVKTNDMDALTTAHDLLARDLAGAERASELVRQAEVFVRAGGSAEEAIQHGEAGLGGLGGEEAEELLDRLAALADRPADVIDLFERQVSRTREPADRIRALARAALVAGTRGQLDRSRSFFELALAGTPSDQTLDTLQHFATEGDRQAGGDRLLRTLCSALSEGGAGARDGGRTRNRMLRRAATIARQDLADIDQAFFWLGDALIANVDDDTLDLVERLAEEVGDPARADAALTRALSEVFDGPLVRSLLSRRARLRRERLGDLAGAAADMKRLHDLAPHDQGVLDELADLLQKLTDFKGLVQLYEDQILRGKDMHVRAELARRVARVWEEQLKDTAESADAWRRVLRMKPGDVEAKEGLDRAKSKQLKTADPYAPQDFYSPPRLPGGDAGGDARPVSRAPAETYVEPEAVEPLAAYEPPRAVRDEPPLAHTTADEPHAPSYQPPAYAEEEPVDPTLEEAGDTASHALSMELIQGIKSQKRSAPPPAEARRVPPSAAPRATQSGVSLDFDDDAVDAALDALTDGPGGIFDEGPAPAPAAPAPIEEGLSGETVVAQASDLMGADLARETVADAGESVPDLASLVAARDEGPEIASIAPTSEPIETTINEPIDMGMRAPDESAPILLDDDEILLEDDIAEIVEDPSEDTQVGELAVPHSRPPPVPRE